MATDTASRGRITGDQILSVIAGSFVGAILIGLVLQAGLGRDGVLVFGGVVGRSSYNTSWVVLFVLSTLLSVAFVGFVSRSINAFVGQVIDLSRRNELLQSILVPLLQRSALTVTTAALGVVYGLLLWVVGYALVLPLWLTVVVGAEGVSVPLLDVTGFLAWVLYGLLVGVLYGLILDS